MTFESASAPLPARGTRISVRLVESAPQDAATVVVPLFSGDGEPELPTSTLIDGDIRQVYAALTAVGATGEFGTITTIPAPEDTSARTIVAVGLGDPEKIDENHLRNASGVAARALVGKGAYVVAPGALGLRAVTEGLILGSYSYTGLRAGADKKEQQEVTIVCSSSDAEEKFTAATIVADAVCFARDLTNAPANLLYPESYANIIGAAGREAGLKVEVIEDKALSEQGFGGILAVGQGSARPPRLVRMEWKPEHAASSVALVGKGITFDTGGISLKPASKMEEMISDMGGSAAMAASVIAAARLNMPIAVTATLPLAENMPSGSATRPGDVITHYGGVTSEVINTDAEGRLVLADAIARACEDEPNYLIDTATLTGAQMVALGARTAGIMGTDEFRDHVAHCGRAVGEKAWAMPLLEEHDTEIVSPIADIRNSANSRNGGMLYAARYLRTFVADDIFWAHVDVAGPAFNTAAPYGINPTRATGAPVRTVIRVLEDLSQR